MTPKRSLLHEPITASIIAAFYYVYNELGYGFLESVYSAGMEMELRRRGHKVAREVRVPVYLGGIRIAWQRVDMLIDDSVVVESKSTEKLPEAASRQLLNYLRATRLEVGMLLHFGPSATFYRSECANRR